jgi:predicted short-subunit dehydrogenase-like oxidoreductase (DUF2520 family)
LPKPEFNIVIVGSGNMAHALGNLFSNSHNIVQVVSRNHKTGNSLAKKLKSVYSKSVKDINTQADFYFLCVPDDEINKVSKSLKHVNGILVHHSGSRTLKEIAHGPKAVIYPFLSVNKLTDLNKKESPVLYQASGKRELFLVKQLLNGFKFKPEETSDTMRAKLHLAAVFVNNFTNHLYYQSEKIAGANKKTRDMLVLLAQQSLHNFKSGKTKENQSGPARRKDINTVKNHLQLLKNDRKIHDIYVSITQSILNTYKHE